MRITVLWHDPNIDDNKNQRNYRNFEKHFGELIGLKDYIVASECLEVCPNKVIVVTSGRKGEEFLQIIHNLPSVDAVIVFCTQVDYHKTWASRFPKVHAVVNSAQVVIEEIRKMYSNEIAGELLSFAKEKGLEIEEAAYFHLRQDVEMEFRAVFLMYMKSLHASTSLAEKVLQELINLKPDQKKEIEKYYNKKKNNLLEAMVYLYSTDIFYEELNKFLAFGQYDKIKNITAAILQEIKKRPDLQLDLKKTDHILYRGLCYPEIVPEYQNNKKGFWPAFTSTSLDEEVAKIFAGPDGIIFRIKLSSENAHPHILVRDMSKHKTEAEVLLLPYFAIQVKNITKKGGLTYIDVDQEESTHVLSLNDAKFKAYWHNAIQKEMKPKIENLFKEAKNETMQRLKTLTYLPKDLIQKFFEIMKVFYSNPQCPNETTDNVLGALQHKHFSTALKGTYDAKTFGFLLAINQGVENLNTRLQKVLTEVFDSFKVKFQSLLGYMLASNYSLDSLPGLSDFNILINTNEILEALDIDQFIGHLTDKKDEEWIEMIQKHINSPKFVGLIESLVIGHVTESFNNLTEKLFEIIKKTMGL